MSKENYYYKVSRTFTETLLKNYMKGKYTIEDVENLISEEVRHKSNIRIKAIIKEIEKNI